MDTMKVLSQELPSVTTDAVFRAFKTTETLELILTQVPTRNLARTRRVCKRANDIITADNVSKEVKIKLFLEPSTQPPSEYVTWKHDMRLRLTWSPSMVSLSEAEQDHRARPIHKLNPALAQLEIHPRAVRHTELIYGFSDAIVHFNAKGLLRCIRDDSPWDKMLLTQPGCSKVWL